MRATVPKNCLQPTAPAFSLRSGTGEIVSYYCRSPLLGEGILLNGERVNLHIAAGGGQTAAGTPLIFGGF